tara:strand:- start:6140 stop:8302 length:2163 start_codon:yes stop_codon:yes gene_type:complete
MPRVHQLKTNFVAGEFDPLLLSRSDIRNYYNAGERVRNAIVIPQGGVSIRPGSKYIWEVPDIDVADGGGQSNIRLIEFRFNTEQTYLIVMHHKAITILRNDVLVATLVTEYSSDDLLSSETSGGDLITSGVYWTQSKDTVLIFHEGHPIKELKRNGSHSDWTFTDYELKNLPRYDFGAVYTDPDEIGVDEVQEIEFPAPGSQGDWTVGDTFALLLEDEQTENISIVTDGPTMALRMQAALRDLPNTSTDGITVSASSTTLTNSIFTVTFSGDDGERIWGSMYYLTISAEQIPTIDIVVATKGQYPGEVVFSADRGYPRCGAFFQGRLWVAGTPFLPHWVWATRPGAPNDFNSSLFKSDYGIAIPADSDDVPAFTAILAGRHLQLFSRSGEFYVPVSDRSAITPENVALRRTSSRGCKAGLRVFEVDGATHFVQRGGRALREMIFAEAEQAYQANNISLLSPHLMLDPIDFALRRSTSTTDADYEFMVNTDGSMTVFCTLRTQEVNAMALWKTEGEYRAVGVVLDDAFFAVKRTINGVVKVFIEKMDHDLTVDCGLTGGAGSSAVLDHLPLQDIEHLLDGVIQQGKAADAGGVLTFARSASDGWEAGLRFAPADDDYPDLVWVVKTLPVEVELPNGASLGRKRRIVNVSMRLHNTSAISMNGKEISFQQFGENLLDKKLSAFTGVKNIRGLLGWGFDGSIVLGSSRSLKATILGLSYGVSI